MAGDLASLPLQEIAYASTAMALLLSAVSICIAIATYRLNAIGAENVGLLDFVKRHSDYVATMKRAETEDEQHISVCSMLDFLEISAYLYNGRRAGSGYRDNIRALLTTTIAGYGGLIGFEAILSAYGPGPDAYSELRKFARMHSVLVSRQSAAIQNTILSNVSPLRRAA